MAKSSASISTSASLLALFLFLILLASVENAVALPSIWKMGLVINRRPELYYDAEVVDEAYRLCWMEIQKDIKTGQRRRAHTGQPAYLKWIPIAGGRRYLLPYSEQLKLSVGENCLLIKGIEIARRHESLEAEGLLRLH